MSRGWVTIVLALGIPACIPDQGSPVVPEAAAEATDMMMDTGSTDDGGGEAEAAAQVSVDISVLGQTDKFWFTPAGADPNTLYVPANALVHFTLQTSPNEEQHQFQIVIPGYDTPVLKMGMPGSETKYDWKAPSMAKTYTAGLVCPVHPGMQSDIVVTP